MVQKAIEVSPQAIDKARKKLLDHYIELLDSKQKAQAKTEEILLKALEGWDRAPKTFEGRINKLGSLGSENPRGPKTRVQAEQKKLWAQVRSMMDEKKYKGALKNLFEQYTLDEKKLFLERMDFYYKEFDLNQSSDWAPLMTVLADEILLNRLHVTQLQNLDGNYSRQISEAHNRILTAQKSLGITKEQRDSVKTKTEGSVADISIDLEKKLKARELEREKEMKENENYNKQKSSKDLRFRGIRTTTDVTDGDMRGLPTEEDYDE